MFRSISVILCVAAFIPIAPAFGDQRSLLVGTWTIDVSRLKIPKPPNSVTIALADVGSGKYKMTVSIVDGDGSTRHGETTFTPDGTPFPELGNADWDSVSITMPSPRILVMAGGWQGHPTNTRVFSLPENGKQMIETVLLHDPDGTPHTRVDFWNRSK
jgi:hypothetical protein